MYKIMLVDDEDEVREGITATVDFAACGFTLCAQATGAIDAIEKAAQFQPDVVFTDVHMPYMDGMEMISRLQEMYPTMKYIVLSGYDDFIYVKQALQRQVLDYLLEPLSAQGLMKVLRRAKEQLDEQDRQRVNLEILRDKVAKNAQQLRRGVVLEYLSGSFGGDAHALCAYPQPVDERIAFPMYLAVLSLERTEENLEVLRRDFDSQPMLLGASVEEVLSEVFKRRQGEFIQYRSQFLLLLPASQEEAIAACDDAIQSLRHYLHLTATAGLSDEIGSYSALSEGYQNAMAALDKRLIAGQGQVYTPSSCRYKASSGSELIAQAVAYTQSNYADKDLSLESLCALFQISQTQFSLLFKREMGTSFLQYLLDQRIAAAQKLLRETSMKIYQIAEETGFGDASYFSYCFKQRCGLSPKEYRMQGGA